MRPAYRQAFVVCGVAEQIPEIVREVGAESIPCYRAAPPVLLGGLSCVLAVTALLLYPDPRDADLQMVNVK